MKSKPADAKPPRARRATPKPKPLPRQDVTEVRRFQKAARESAEALRRSEASLRDFFDNATIAMHWVGPDGIILWANRAELELVGYSNAEYIGHSIAEFHADAPVIEDLLERLTAGQTIADYEARLRCQDGSIRHVLINSNALFEDGKFIHSRCFTRDITERKQSETARFRLAAIVESSEDAIISKDTNGIIATWNAGAERIFGYTAAEAVGQPVTLFIPPERYAEEAAILERIRRGEPIKHYETVRRRKDGSLINVSLTVSPIMDSQGHIIGASKIARDITERKVAEEALHRAQAQLADRAVHLEQAVGERTAELTTTNRQLEAFAYSVAHDLRAPLRWMEAFSAMLVEEEPTLSERGREFARRINRSAQFLDALLKDLLTFSGVAQQRIELGPVNLEAIVQSVISRLEVEIQEKGAQVEAPGPWASVIGHAPTLGQVLFNLVNNALKFAAPGLSPIVRVRAEKREPFPSLPASLLSQPEIGAGSGFIRVWVEDNGIGIAPSHREQIFRLFTRLHGEKYPGTGLGLAIVQKGIERMGGHVGVESIVGQGSRFWIDLLRA